MIRSFRLLMVWAVVAAGCSKNSGSGNAAPPPQPFRLTSVTINGRTPSSLNYDVSVSPIIRLSFTAAIDHASAGGAISLIDNAGATLAVSPSFANGDSTVVIQPPALKHFFSYTLQAATSLKSQSAGYLLAGDTPKFITSIDSTDKSPRISDSALLDLVQKQTLSYFWDFGHPVSGLARER